MKLHLGCGQRYFDGYVNIDYPASEHSVQQSTVADEFANLLEINYPFETIDEVRLHHVFEHFSRSQSCALLASWNSWLKPNGIIHIEVPDFTKTAKIVLNPFSNLNQKLVALRHIFGSQEAHWAIHFEGHSKDTLKRLLELFGFTIIEFKRNSWLGTHNIEVVAKKTTNLTKEQAFRAAEKYLTNYMVSDVESEQTLLKTWLEDFKNQLNKSFCKIN